MFHLNKKNTSCIRFCANCLVWTFILGGLGVFPVFYFIYWRALLWKSKPAVWKWRLSLCVVKLARSSDCHTGSCAIAVSIEHFVGCKQYKNRVFFRANMQIKAYFIYAKSIQLWYLTFFVLFCFLITFWNDAFIFLKTVTGCYMYPSVAW